MYQNRDKKLQNFEHTESLDRSICHGQKILNSKMRMAAARKMPNCSFLGVSAHFQVAFFPFHIFYFCLTSQRFPQHPAVVPQVLRVLFCFRLVLICTLI